MSRPAPRPIVVAMALALFVVWSQTFLAFELLLAPRTGPAPLDWWGLTVARNVPVGIACAMWCFVAHARESLAIVRAHPLRLLACGALVVPCYNGFLYHGMQARVAGPIASLLTSLTPLYLIVLGMAFLGETLTRRKLLGLALGLAGVAMVASAKSAGASAEWVHVLQVAMAPLSWACYSALTRPVARERSPFLWTCLVLIVGTLLLVPAIPFLGAPDPARLDGRSLALLVYLAFGATIAGNAVWSWLLRQLPASTAGMTIFLNPPLTLCAKAFWSAVLPASFAFSIAPTEWVGGAVMLAGVALAVIPGATRVKEVVSVRASPTEGGSGDAS